MLIGGLTGVLLAFFHPDTPLPPQWNPTEPLAVAHPVTPLTSSKLRNALSDPEQCLVALTTAAQFSTMDSFEETENCHIRNRVAISTVGASRLDRIETSCATALRLAMWERHGVQPAAQEYLGSSATVLRQVGSYNCRPIRTSQGASSRWSTHATADAIDITGFDFADGRRIRLINDWNDGTEEAQFLRAVRDSACRWFATALGPDYNRLHADHFHLQARGWGTCR
ncbi:extensin-like domain-containing protein [Octadecabacter ascidiaceicola]|nr:extensin family protein [Octadecabacter ascidiaceicola]